MSTLSPWLPVPLRGLILAAIGLSLATGGFWLRGGSASETIGEAQVAALTSVGDVPARLALAALDCTRQTVRYDPAYVVIDYPGGDVPADTGVCTDVVIRSYRGLGIDLQQRVHEDMRAHFSRYPALWGLRKPDPNIDHRRVPNLQTYFTRHGDSLPVSERVADYRPGDVVAWDLNRNGLWHIGIVVGEDAFVHNIGGGQVIDRGLFQWKVIGHYRYHPEAGAPL